MNEAPQLATQFSYPNVRMAGATGLFVPSLTPDPVVEVISSQRAKEFPQIIGHDCRLFPLHEMAALFAHRPVRNWPLALNPRARCLEHVVLGHEVANRCLRLVPASLRAGGFGIQVHGRIDRLRNPINRQVGQQRIAVNGVFDLPLVVAPSPEFLDDPRGQTITRLSALT
jgi:hypothetical protein